MKKNSHHPPGAIALLLVLFHLLPARADFPTIRLVPVSEGELVAPVSIRNAGDSSGRLFTVDQRGKIQIIDPNGDLLDVLCALFSSRLNAKRGRELPRPLSLR